MSVILRKAGKDLLVKHLNVVEPADPVYEWYDDNHGIKQRRKRPLPPGLEERDQEILRKVRRRARRLDKGFNLCGLRFGYTFFLSLIPVVGDIACAVLNYSLVVRKARQAGIPESVVARMMANNAFSFGVSFIPLVGDVILAAYGANSRNAALLEAVLVKRGAEKLLKAHTDGVIPPIEKKKKGWSWGKPKATTAPDDRTAHAEGGSSHLTNHDARQLRPNAGFKKSGELVDGDGEREAAAARTQRGALNV